MKLEDLYKIAVGINDNIGDGVKADMTIYLNESKHENLQQQVYKLQNQTLQGYNSESVFQVVLFNTKFIFKMK